ncbi:MAG TPA: signal peptidase I [Candidatus Microsaccharimonas sp.]|jgi:signal peptidase
MSWVALALVVLGLLVPAILFATGVIPYGVYVVHTGSMKPTMPLASAVIVRDGQPKLNEPITFYQHNEVITHRWIGTNADGTLITKGDANRTADPWQLNKSDVIGGVVNVVPALGYWITFVKNPATWGALLLVVVDIWLLWPLIVGPSRKDKPTPVQVA